MAEYNFKKDIILGEQGEIVVAKDLISMGATLISDNKDNKYDLLMERADKQIKYEIKTDVFCKPTYDTGNMFLEYECRGKASGLYVTEAEWFVTYYQHLNEIWYIQTDVLKSILENNDIRKTVGGDKGSNTKGYLLPRNKYKKHFIIRKVL